MTPMRKNLAFTGGALAAIAGWALCSPQTVSREMPREADAGATKKPRWDPTLLPGILKELETAEGNETRLKAAARLNEVPVSGIAAALEQVKLVENRKLSFAARALLNRWAASDGEAAMNWAWAKLGTTPQWKSAFDEIGASWAWSHPSELAAWAMKTAPTDAREAPAAGTGTSGQPFAPDPFAIASISKWLAPREPQLAYQVLNTRNSFTSEDSKIAEMLDTPDQCRQALLAFDNLDQMKPGTYRGNELQAGMLMTRWRDIDPESFARSPYAAMIEPAKKAVTSPHVIVEFRKWSQGHADARPDMTGWPESKKQAWNDLKVLGPEPQ